MTARIEWVASQCRLLATIRDEFERTLPFAGLTIGTGIHIEPKTVALLLTLHRGGARVISTGNLNTTQPESVAYLNAHGVEAIDLREQADMPAYVRERTGGRGPDSVIDAVGMEAHGAPIGKLAHRLAGLESFATHRVPLEEAPHAYEIFQKKQDGAFKVLLQP